MSNEIVIHNTNISNNPKQLKRLIVASVILAACLLCIFIIVRLQANVEKLENIKSTVDYLEQDRSNGATTFPAKFEEELFSATTLAENNLKLSDINVSDSKNIIGCVCDGSSNKVAESIKSQMQTRGWAFLSSGDENILSAQKGNGKYTYAYIQLFDIEGRTSVVLTIN